VVGGGDGTVGGEYFFVASVGWKEGERDAALSLSLEIIAAGMDGRRGKKGEVGEG
jgi:hypothetical protein